MADNKQIIRHPEEFFDLLETITSDKRFLEAKEMLTEEERKEGVTMCDGLDRIENRGIEKGKESMLQLVQCMMENGETGLIPELSRKPELLQEMYQKYNLLY